MSMQDFITIFHSVQGIWPFSRFQNLELGKASTAEKFHFAIPWARICQYQCLRKSFFSKDSTRFKGHFHFFRKWRSTDDKCYFAIPWTRSCQYQNILQYLIKIVQTVKSYGHFSQTVRGQLGKASTDEKCYFEISWARSCQYQSLRKILSKYSKRPFSLFHKVALGIYLIQIFQTVKNYGHFRKLSGDSSAKPRPMKNVSSQSLGLGLVNINVNAKVYRNIPLSSRDRVIFAY